MPAEPDRVAARNRKARHNYLIEDSIETGIVLAGTEVKALRDGRGNIAEAYAAEQDGELWLYNAYIPEYQAASQFQHETRRPRKLLLHRREIDRLIGRVQKDGMTLVPLDIHFNRRGIAKVLLGIARGKRKYDKREAEKSRDWRRQKERLMREKG
ncbi:MAG: SsrA-binding protein SmpB [Alphaproteobacteria bacterium]|nr:SsrA-binding protein SmpB [Alphaproteobacteria bacterium]